MYNCEDTLSSLKLELQSLKTVVNEVGAYIYTKDLNGCYTYANSMVLELFNVSLSELVGRDDSHFFDLELSNELKNNDEQVLKHGKIVEIEEVNIIKSTGEERTYLTFKKPLYDDNKNIIGMCGISNDITERKKLEQELAEQKHLLNTILDNIDAYIYMKDDKRTFKYVNSKVAKLFGYSPEEIIGRRDIEVMPKEVADEFWEMDKKVFDSGVSQTKEEVFFDDDGNERHYWSVKLPYEMQKDYHSLIGLSTDITELQLLKEELRIQSITDDLTGVNNRRFFVSECINEFNRTKRHNLNLSIIILDIDWFKSINDSYGHLEGDKLIISLAKMCMNLKRKEDTFSRIGGEEFAFILPHTSLEKAKEFATRLQLYHAQNSIKGPWSKEKSITFSIGISSYSHGDTKYEDILLRADNALYEAKNTGRDKICTK